MTFWHRHTRSCGCIKLRLDLDLRTRGYLEASRPAVVYETLYPEGNQFHVPAPTKRGYLNNKPRKNVKKLHSVTKSTTTGN